MKQNKLIGTDGEVLLGRKLTLYFTETPSLSVKTMSLVLESLLDRMEDYTNNMESLVEEMTEDYFNEKKKTENLLYELLPKYTQDISQ